MICPFCNIEYTFEDPCFCQPGTQSASKKGDEDRLKPLAEERQVPTGLDNPFWKPEETTRVAPKRPRPGL